MSGSTPPTTAPAPAAAAPLALAVEAPAAPAAPVAPAAPSVDPVAQERARISGIMGAFKGTAFMDEAEGFIDGGKTVAEAQAHVLGKLKATPAATAPAVTQQALAQEGRMASAAAAAPAPVAPTGAEGEASALRLAMTSGADQHRANVAGGNPHNRFQIPTTTSGR